MTLTEDIKKLAALDGIKPDFSVLSNYTNFSEDQFYYDYLYYKSKVESLFKSLQKQIAELKENFQPKAPTEWLTRNEVAELLKVDLSTLWNWQKNLNLFPMVSVIVCIINGAILRML